MNDRFYLGMAFGCLMLLFMVFTSLVALLRAPSLVSSTPAAEVPTLPCGDRIVWGLGGLGHETVVRCEDGHWFARSKDGSWLPR